MSSSKRANSAAGDPVPHYIQELIALKRYLQPGTIPMGDSFGWRQPEPGAMVYLGEVELRFDFCGTIGELTDDLALQTRLREKAKAVDLLNDEDDDQEGGGPAVQIGELELELECGQVFAGVEFPLVQLSAREQALYKMRVLLVNTQGVLHGEGHSWSLSVGEEQAIDMYGTRDAKTSDWRTECANAEGQIVEMLLQAGVDLQEWCYTEAAYYGEGELPDTPPLAWVQERKVAHVLFGLTDEETSETLERAIAFALHALRESQPQSFRSTLFLADVLGLDQPTLEDCNARIADRLSTLSALSTYANDIRTASSVEQVNEVLKKVFDAAPALGIWIIA